MVSIALTVLFLLNLVNTNCRLIQEFQQACPYTNLCTIPSLKTFNGSNDVTPCCYDCFCDEDCWAYDDCCPDMDVNYTSSRGLSVKLECKASYVNNTFVKEIYNNDLRSLDVQHHRIIDFCPGRNSVNSVVNRKCEGNDDEELEYDDVTLVSDDRSRIFKNKHCARCHGVEGFVSWKLVITDCRDKLDTLQLTLSEYKNYVLNNCVITFQRPNNVPLNGRILTCLATTCDFEGRDQILGQKCEEAPHMPYFDIDKRNVVRMFKNFYCALCARSALGPTMCSVHDTRPVKSTINSWKVLIDPVKDTIPTGPPVQSKCGEGMVYDPHKDGCRRFYCPPFEVATNDKCVKMTENITDLYVAVNIVFPAFEKNIIQSEGERTMYNNSLTEHYSKLLLSRFGLVHCDMHKLVVTLFRDKTTKQIFAILAEMQFGIKGKCSLKYLGKVIKMLEKRVVKIDWTLNEMVLDIEGHVSFFYRSLLDEEYDWNLLIYNTIDNRNRLKPLSTFFLCRHGILNRNEYNAWAVKFGPTNYTLPDELSKLSPTIQLLPGFYAVSENDIAMCVETYMPSVSGKGYVSKYELGVLALAVIFCLALSLILI